MKKKPEGSSPNTRFLQQFAQKHESFTYKKHCLKIGQKNDNF